MKQGRPITKKDDEAHVLAKQLANRLDKDNWMTWVEVVLGENMGGAPRADLLAANKSYTQLRFVIYEVKISRSDFSHEVSTGKYLSYLPHCNQFYFACPSGVINRADVPDDCGLIVKGPHGWSVVVAARLRTFTPTRDFLLKLLMRGYEDYLPEWRQGQRQKLEDFEDYRDMAASHGIKIAHDLASAKDFVAEAEKLRTRLNKALGIDNRTLESAVYGIQSAVEELLAQHRYAGEALDLAEIAHDLFRHHYGSADNAAHRIRVVADRLDKRAAGMEQNETH